MSPKKPIPEEKQDSMLIKAATTIGKAAGRVVRLIRPEKATPDPAPKKRSPAKKTQSTVRKRAAAKKTARKAKRAVRSSR